MKTFDELLPGLQSAFESQYENLGKIDRLIVNRDLNGVIRLVADGKKKQNKEQQKVLDSIKEAIIENIGDRLPSEHPILYEQNLDEIIQGKPHFDLEGFKNVTIVDRMLSESDWTNISPVSTGTPRFVFFSLKGGVGRTTALAVGAWYLAEMGKKVMVLDIDLQSPGLSDSLLPLERCPKYGITDWLVEDLLNNGSIVFQDMMATSELSRNGEIFVIPAHGKEPGEYIAKLGRAWMSKTNHEGIRELWQERLNRLIGELENKWKPDVILIDSRAGIDEVSSACITSLGAKKIFLFALNNEQTWKDYAILFNHWQRSNSIIDIRERLQTVAAMLPDIDTEKHALSLCENSWNLFINTCYDDIQAGDSFGEPFNFDLSDRDAPHFPWEIQWSRGLTTLQNLYSLFLTIDKEQVSTLFGQLVRGIAENVE